MCKTRFSVKICTDYRLMRHTTPGSLSDLVENRLAVHRLPFERPAAQPASWLPVKPGVGIEDLRASGHTKGTDDRAIPSGDHGDIPVVPVAQGTCNVPEPGVVAGRSSHPAVLSGAFASQPRGGRLRPSRTLGPRHHDQRLKYLLSGPRPAPENGSSRIPECLPALCPQSSPNMACDCCPSNW